ncbi:segregation and condensation protein A [Curvivirga sp.]|uniref:segregation and condensation protein A n=1 Tax=Curvivirga sp. TaxID=2856848 RepID=UPI003B5B190A
MDLQEDFNSEFEEDDAPAGRSPADLLFLALDGYEGPIDLLLSLARDQKVDLAKISIVALADQYLEFISRVRQLRLEIAADYLVMAAWLAYLKSRLLLPEQPSDEDEESPEDLAARLAFQLRRLEAMQKASKELMAIPQIGQDFYRRGDPEAIKVENTSTFDLSLYDLLKAYGSIRDKMTASTLRIMPTELYSMDDAIERLRDMLGGRRVPNWSSLETFLPDDLKDTLVVRSATAATFAASLELAREGLLEIRQNGIFAPIFFRSNPDAPEPEVDDIEEENLARVDSLLADLEVD